MFIQTIATPNPAVLKFVPGCDVMGNMPPADFPNAASAHASPLAQALFAIDHVTSVFFGSDFIAITKDEYGEWQLMRPALLTTIMEHFVADVPLITQSPTASTPQREPINAEHAAIITQIEDIINTRIRPAVAQDGGDIVFHGFENGIVSLHMRGACAGCPSATATLKNGIENLLRHYIPEVTQVRAVL